jgi:hypothetical protein
MRYLITLIYCLALLRVNAQLGYSKTYDFDSPGMSFFNIKIQNDTLLVFGPVYHESIPNLQGLFFAQLDTLGNLLSYHTYFDSLGGDLTARPHCTIYKLINGSGYIIPAGSFTRSTGIICFINGDGEFTKIVEHSDNTSQTEIYNTLIEINDGLLLFGTKSRLDFLIDIFVMKTDKLGNKLWEKYYDSPGRQWLLGTIYKENDNQYLIGAATTKPQNTPFNQLDYQTVFFRIDSSGNKLWQWESQLGLNEIGSSSLQKNNDGNWMYAGGEIMVFANQGYITKNTKIVIRDEDFNLIVEKIVSPPSSELNGFVDIQPTQDGNWLGIGAFTTPPLWTQPNALAGWMYKYDDNLDSIWSREDTVFYNTQIYTDHWLHGAVQLPSGSIIAAGQINVYHPAPGKSWGWLIKVSKDGCIDTLACSVSAIKNGNNYQMKNMKVFPNPTNGLLFFDDTEILWDKIEIINLQGQLMEVFNRPDKTELNLTDMQAGMYMIRFVRKGESLVRRIFKT